MPGFMAWLLRSSGEAVVLILLVLLVQALLGGRLRPCWRYRLWWLVLLRLILPVFPESRLSLFNGNFYAQTVFEWCAGADLGGPSASASGPDGKADLGGTPQFVPGDRPRGRAELTASPDTRPDVSHSAHVHASEPSFAVRPAVAARFQQWLIALWLGGVAVLSSRLLVQNYRFSRRLRHQAPVSDAKVLRLLADCQRAMSVSRRLVCLETAAVSGPALCGLWRKRLLLPPHFLERYQPEELRHVFLHELAHLKRHDMAVSWLMAALRTLHWFNPLIWMAFRRIAADRELACDELALSALGTDQAEAYGGTVIRLLEDFATSAAAPGLVGIVEDNLQMKERIRMIASFNTPKRSAPGVAILAALALVTLTNAKTAERPKAADPARAAENASSPHGPASSLAPDAPALAALQRWEAQIERDDKAPGNPVVGVTITKGDFADEDLRHLRAFPQLRKLLINGENITDAGLEILAGLDQLAELTMFPRTRITDAGMAHLAKLPRLQVLSLDWCSITDDGIRHLRGFSNLRALILISALPHTSAFSRITDKSCEYIRELTALERLGIINGDLSSAGLEHLAGLTNLTFLNLGANPTVDSDGLKHLGNLTKLKKLYLFGTAVGDEGMHSLANLKNLELLDLSGTYVGDEGLAHLRQLSRLESLDLGAMHEPYLSIGGAHVTDAGLVHLSQMVNLKRLWLCSNRITDAGLVHLKPLGRLTWLGLDGTRITDQGIAALQELGSLEALSLGSTRVTDAGLAQLEKLPSLRGLGLSDLNITDAGLKHLASIEKLKQVQIWGMKKTKVTQAGLDELKRALPGVQLDIQ